MLPINVTLGVITSDTPTYVRQLDRHRQAKPFNLVLPYWSRSCRITRWDRSNPPEPQQGDPWLFADGSMTSWSIANDARIIAYDRFKGNMYSSASLGQSFAEIGQSYRMIAKRATQLAEFFHSIRRGNLLGALQQIGIARPAHWTPRQIGRIRAKSFASKVLETNFGWAPLVRDVQDAAEVLANPYACTHHARGSGNSQQSGVLPRTVDVYISKYADQAKVIYTAKVSVTNPNLFLANQLGVINPIVVGYNLIPYSFLFDWVSNLGSFLSYSTDFCGLTLTDATTSTLVRSQVTRTWDSNNGSPVWHEDYDRSNFTRVTGITTPSLSLRPYKAPGLRRAANAISLLIQQLKVVR